MSFFKLLLLVQETSAEVFTFLVLGHPLDDLRMSCGFELVHSLMVTGAAALTTGIVHAQVISQFFHKLFTTTWKESCEDATADGVGKTCGSDFVIGTSFLITSQRLITEDLKMA